LCSETSITAAALPSGWTAAAAACLSRWPRILFEYPTSPRLRRASQPWGCLSTVALAKADAG
jgi:hypothetical protein